MDLNQPELDKIEDNYPLMISQNILELKQCCFEKAYDQLFQINQIFEVILKYLTSIAVRSYLYSDGKSDKINEIIRGFRTPSNGKWNELLRECALQAKKASNTIVDKSIDLAIETPLTLSKKISDFYFAVFPNKSNNELYKKAVDFQELDNTWKMEIKPSNKCLFDLMVKVRNDWLGHTAKKTENEYESAVSIVYPIITHLLCGIEFIIEYPIYYVREVKVEKGIFNHIVDRCMGRDFRRGLLPLSEAPLNNKEIYILKINENKDNGPEVKWALSLSPYLIVENCIDCKSQQVFFFGNYKGKQIAFDSYRCGHKYTPTAFTKDLEDIFDFLDGKIPIREILQGKTIGSFFQNEANLAISPERRTKAKEHIEKGLEYLRDDDLILAIKSFQEAIGSDKDNAQARFLLAMCQILNMEEIDKITCGLKKAVELDPENSKYTIALAKIFLELGKTDDAFKYLYRTVELDPTHQEARQLLDENLANKQ